MLRKQAVGDAWSRGWHEVIGEADGSRNMIGIGMATRRHIVGTR
jgi:hypothetical protein